MPLSGKFVRGNEELPGPDQSGGNRATQAQPHAIALRLSSTALEWRLGKWPWIALISSSAKTREHSPCKCTLATTTTARTCVIYLPWISRCTNTIKIARAVARSTRSSSYVFRTHQIMHRDLSVSSSNASQHASGIGARRRRLMDQGF